MPRPRTRFNKNGDYYQENKEKHANAMQSYFRTSKGRHVQLKSKSKQKGIPCSLTLEQYEEIISDPFCSYCCELLPETGYSVDRLDNSLGYTLENCVACCFTCNSRKGGLELAGFRYPRTVELMRELLS